MSSVVTSFTGMFEAQGNHAPKLTDIEIPLIQRDYAQGREDAKVTDIRSNFLDALHSAVTGGEPIGLDFVYGEIDGGTLRPLDGQQRLTTLFLLHWYLAFRSGRLGENHAWKSFSYATRPSARTFGKRLANWTAEAGTGLLSDRVRNQPWYQHGWRHDPTIQSMLVVLDAIDERFREEDVDAVWARLTDAEQPAISFHLLPISDMGSGEDLYIKMNSRGKPLTDFENFKAGFEKTVAWSTRAADLALRIDTVWSDVLWPYRGDNDIVDDEFENYITFVTQLCEWRDGDFESDGRRLIDRAAVIFGHDHPQAAANLDFLFDAFDTWRSVDIAAVMDDLFSVVATPGETERVIIFGTDVNPNLFDACCHDYGTTRFGYPRMLLLYAVLLHRIHQTEDFPRRLRLLRNLIEASENELRAERMPDLVEDVRRVVVDGALEKVERFNINQVEDEKRKAAFLTASPDLTDVVFRLEDHPVLRGALASFELDPDRLVARVNAFWAFFSDDAVLPALTGAMLTCGDYSRPRSPNVFQFGSPERTSWWRELFTATSYANLDRTRAVLGAFLDQVAASTCPVAETLADMRSDWLVEHEAGPYDWRYYLIRYDTMRTGTSGIYAVPDQRMGYSVCMLRAKQMNSLYRDPYLVAALREADVRDAVQDGTDGPRFTGYATAERWLRLNASNTGLRCVEDGWLLDPPTGKDRDVFDQVRFGMDGLTLTENGYLFAVPQTEVDGRAVDTVDRVEMAAGLLQALVAAGL
ncbi:DUF262 domain-containing protein [Oryzihumus leptocrescens]|uniref:Uncharacterized protein DUF262 n=1 Tax=Oryzihumus leptocrescens TaxID=297536 RepID=A0A542ZKT7_9MICO|nr:DUF262 domain-containing protein [Oryzihumus leptocrescens]TQL60972.1 uncharacterized protein DUF262 [Oryzihumus leptocrescens]